MSFFKKVMASVGIGSAKVDTRLESGRLQAGETFTGIVMIKGGNVEQRISGVRLNLMTKVKREVNDQEVMENVTLCSFRLSESFVLQPNENKEIPFELKLPDETPATFQRLPLWLQTDLDIDMAMDPSDQDYIEVLPHRHVQPLLNALEQAGFRLKSVEGQLHRGMRGVGFLQEYDFYPPSRFRNDLEELEVLFIPGPEGVQVIFEFDRRARGLAGLFAEALDLDDPKRGVYFSGTDLKKDTASLADEITNMVAGQL